MTSWPLRIAGGTIPIDPKRQSSKAPAALPSTDPSHQRWRGGQEPRADRGASSGFRHKPVLDKGSLHSEAQTGLGEVELHLSIALHRQHPLKQSRSEASAMRLLDWRSAALRPFQIQLSLAVFMDNIPVHLNLASADRERAVLGRVSGQLV